MWLQFPEGQLESNENQSEYFERGESYTRHNRNVVRAAMKALLWKREYSPCE